MEKTTYSFSRITTFEQCARRFRLRYLDGVREGFRSVEAFVGQQVHSTLEWLFTQREQGSAPTAEQTVGRYCELWDSEVVSPGGPVKLVRRDRPMEAYRKDGARIVDTFHRERFSSDRLKTEAVEGHLAMDLGAYRFQGFIDRLARDERGLLHIIDYKTGRRVPRSFSGKEAEQLEAYAALVFSAGQERELNLVLEFVRNGKRRSHRISADEAVAIAGRLKTRIDAVEASTVFPPSPGRLCDWCGFNDICDAYGDQRSSARGDEPFSISL